MAEAIKISVDLRGFGAFLAAAEAAVALAVEGAAEAVVNDAKERAPVLTGYLRDHISYEMSSPLEAEVLSEADYSAVVDEGGVNRPANPFFTGAVEAERQRFPERIAEALAEVTGG
jgi:hypothetical protein